MELGTNIMFGNKSVVRITVGNTQIYPNDIFDVDQTQIDVDAGNNYIEVTVVSVVSGVASSVSMSIGNNGIGMTSSGYVDGSALGERIYSFHIPFNSSYESRYSQIIFTQTATGKKLYVDVWQEEQM